MKNVYRNLNNTAVRKTLSKDRYHEKTNQRDICRILEK